MSKDLQEAISKFTENHGDIFIDGTSAYVISNEGFWGPCDISMGSLEIYNADFDINITKLLDTYDIEIDDSNRFDDDFLEDLCRKYYELIGDDYSDEYLDEFVDQLGMFLEGCMPESIYLIVNAGEYIDLEDCIMETQEFTEWDSMDNDDTKVWIDDLEHATKLEKHEMIA